MEIRIGDDVIKPDRVFFTGLISLLMSIHPFYAVLSTLLLLSGHILLVIAFLPLILGFYALWFYKKARDHGVENKTIKKGGVLGLIGIIAYIIWIILFLLAMNSGNSFY